MSVDLSSFMDFPLKGKIVAITGGGSGISLSFAKLAHNAGARIIIADLQLTKDAEAFVESAASKDPSTPTVVYQHCNVTSWSDLEAIVTASKKQFHDVPDVYVAGAGVFEPDSSNFWHDPEKEGGYAEVEINLNHPIKFTRIAIRELLGANKRGVALIVASQAGFAPFYPGPLYAATKHGLVGFGRSMAEAAGLQGVKVVVACPGLTNTPLFTERPNSDIARRFNIGDHTMTADDVAKEMVALVEKAEFPGGTILEVTKAGPRVIPTWGSTPPPLPEVGPEQIPLILEPILERMTVERQGVVV